MSKQSSIIIVLAALVSVHAVLFFLPPQLYETYFNILRPFAYVVIMIFTYFTLSKTIKIHSGKQTLMLVAVLGVVAYAATSFIVGLFMGFGQNTMNLTFLGILRNFWAFIFIIILREIVRFSIMINVREKYKYLKLVGIAFVFAFISLDNLSGVIKFDLFQQIDWLFTVFLPLIAMNLWFTYAAMHGGIRSNLIFALGHAAVIYFSPILPDIPQILDAIIIYCIVFLMFIIYDSVEWADKRSDGIDVQVGNRRHWGWSAVPVGFIVVCILFGIGAFQVMPVAVASNSMLKEFSRGDLIYVQKTSPDNLSVGDIVQYNKGGTSIVHRIIEIREDTVRGRYFIFKGDENVDADMFPVYDEQIIGLVVAKTPFLGFPALLFQGLKE